MPDAFKITACTAGHEQIFVLPPADNADHRIYLHADRFGLHEDACILLEALDGVWRIRTGSWQRMEERGKPFSVHAIRDGDTLLLATPAGDRIALLVRARAEVLSGYEEVTADPMLQGACRSGCQFHDLPHFALSGRLYLDRIKSFITKDGRFSCDVLYVPHPGARRT